uniref:Uncharacterized protein n=1 Tax=Odontella aurita TaxID=265563 RepID=A0A7S4HJU7_9STRA|mmetsp:Transcript_11029/g.32686  ORF Transcript_11029/g.32686 Transcript_11029/m.32686 type:complete len:412 (+) Transcript_11029:114-1349(+)
MTPRASAAVADIIFLVFLVVVPNVHATGTEDGLLMAITNYVRPNQGHLVYGDNSSPARAKGAKEYLQRRQGCKARSRRLISRYVRCAYRLRTQPGNNLAATKKICRKELKGETKKKDMRSGRIGSPERKGEDENSDDKQKKWIQKKRGTGGNPCPAAADINIMGSIAALCFRGNFSVRQCLTFAEAYAGYTNYAAQHEGASKAKTSSRRPGLRCPKEARNCPDGSLSFRSRDLSCDFAPCPCCDALSEPGKFGNDDTPGDYVCCPDGSWGVESDENGVFLCSGGGMITSLDLRRMWQLHDGKPGENCNLNRKREDGRTRCPKDTVICPDGKTQVKRNWNTVRCIFEPCKSKCCKHQNYIECKDGSQARCCPDNGSWACPEIDAVLKTSIGYYRCEGGLLSGDLGPFGVACP